MANLNKDIEERFRKQLILYEDDNDWGTLPTEEYQFIKEFIASELERQKKELVKHLKEKFTQGFHEVEISYEDLDQAIKTIKNDK